MRVSEGRQVQCAVSTFVSVDRDETRKPSLYLAPNIRGHCKRLYNSKYRFKNDRNKTSYFKTTDL